MNLSTLSIEKIQRLLYVGIAISLGFGTVSIGQLGHGNLRIWEVLLALYCIFSLLRCVADGDCKFTGSTIFYSVFAFWCAGLFSGIAASNVDLWTKQMTLLTAMAILCLVASQRRDIARTISTYRWLAYSGSLVAAFGIFQLYWWPEGLQTYAGLEMIVPRARAFFAEANEFSQFLVLPFAFSLVLLLFAPAIRWFERICLIAGIIIIICAQLLTFSRGGILSFVVESAVIIVISMRVNSKRYPKSASKLTRLLVVLTVCVAVWAFSAWFMESSIGIIWERISVLFSGSDPTSGIRWDNYLDATRGLTVTPLGALTGIGFGNLPTVLQDGVATTANFLVDIYTETGLFGAIAYIVILYQVVNIGLRSIVFSRSTDRSRYLAAAGPLVALCGLIAGGLTYATHMLNFSWFICGMLFALSISSTTTRESDSPVPALQ